MKLDELVELLNDFVAENPQPEIVSVVDAIIGWAIRTNRVEVE